MGNHVIKKGLDLPIAGQPTQEIDTAPAITKVALLGHDYPTMKPRMHVQVGDQVQRGQLLFEDRKAEGIHFTAPGAGEVAHHQRRHALEERRGNRVGARGLEHFWQQRVDLRLGDQRPVDAHALAEAGDVRRDEQARAVARGLQALLGR